MLTDWSPLWLSLRVAALGTVGALLPGLWLAHLLTTQPGAPAGARSAILTLLSLLLATPVVILTFLLRRAAWTWQLAAAAGILAALPCIVRGASAAWQSLDREYAIAARSLGNSEVRIFLRILLPLSWRALLAAMALAFSRILAEWIIVSALLVRAL
jgi:molybdate transport system permease protein